MGVLSGQPPDDYFIYGVRNLRPLQPPRRPEKRLRLPGGRVCFAGYRGRSLRHMVAFSRRLCHGRRRVFHGRRPRTDDSLHFQGPGMELLYPRSIYAMETPSSRRRRHKIGRRPSRDGRRPQEIPVVSAPKDQSGSPNSSSPEPFQVVQATGRGTLLPYLPPAFSFVKRRDLKPFPITNIGTG